MTNEINEMLMALDEMGYDVERVMDCYVTIRRGDEVLFASDDFAALETFCSSILYWSKGACQNEKDSLHCGSVDCCCPCLHFRFNAAIESARYESGNDGSYTISYELIGQESVHEYAKDWVDSIHSFLLGGFVKNLTSICPGKTLWNK